MPSSVVAIVQALWMGYLLSALPTIAIAQPIPFCTYYTTQKNPLAWIVAAEPTVPFTLDRVLMWSLHRAEEETSLEVTVRLSPPGDTAVGVLPLVAQCVLKGFPAQRHFHLLEVLFVDVLNGSHLQVDALYSRGTSVSVTSHTVEWMRIGEALQVQALADEFASTPEVVVASYGATAALLFSDSRLLYWNRNERRRVEANWLLSDVVPWAFMVHLCIDPETAIGGAVWWDSRGSKSYVQMFIVDLLGSTSRLLHQLDPSPLLSLFPPVPHVLYDSCHFGQDGGGRRRMILNTTATPSTSAAAYLTVEWHRQGQEQALSRVVDLWTLPFNSVRLRPIRNVTLSDGYQPTDGAPLLRSNMQSYEDLPAVRHWGATTPRLSRCERLRVVWWTFTWDALPCRVTGLTVTDIVRTLLATLAIRAIFS